jgi:hypothetical protein
MRRTLIFISLAAIAALLLSHANAARFAARAQTPDTARPVASQPGAQPNAATDLSGTYHGVFTIAATGETVPAVFKIEGEHFTVTVGDRVGTGTIKPITPRDFSAVEMIFIGRSPFGDEWAFGSGGGWSCTLRVSRVGARLTLTPVSNGAGAFSFHSAAAGERGNRNLASADHNTACVGCSNANVSHFNANTSVNTNAVPNPTPAVFVVNSNTPTETTGVFVSGRRHARRARSANSEDVMPLPEAPVAVAARSNPTLARVPLSSPPPTAISPVTPSASPQPTAPADNAVATYPSAVSNIINNLPPGGLALDAPSKMVQGVPRIFTARVSFGKISPQITEGMPATATTEPIEHVSEEMRVTLMEKEKDTFSIREMSEPTQIIAGKPYAEWTWEVTPLQSGSHALHLNASAIITPPGQSEKPYVIPTKDRDINVEVNYKYVAKQLLNKYWSLLFGGVSVFSVATGGKKAYNWWKGRGGSTT